MRPIYSTNICRHPHGDLDEMYKIVAEMRQRGCEPDLVTFNILLFAHLKADVRLRMPAVYIIVRSANARS